MRSFFISILVFIGLSVQAQKLKIVEKPIIWDSLRQALSVEYLKDRHGISQKTPAIRPKMVVCHWTAIPTFEKSFLAFNSSTLPNTRKELQNASQLNVSAHYLIDRDGTVYHLMPDTLLARHVIGLNYCAIGIENVGDGSANPLTEEQFRANYLLIKQLKKKYKIKYLIGHHEYTKFKDSDIWKETDPNYQTIKFDPGDEFMNKLRAKFKHLKKKP
ncbi:N-acetylmuramyl-L-alanine amidase, negative regulator of AmpC, AmpD [Emticicia oligotrophica DSM 17448]|uniref:N-acetylmuramoyl-L-alanine amidase n=1 Tax=Emticicia oligotrophica (strain DSM 17448 / CIP 109782 / MTCC 6937 / GPTSA100-15) TaxID=929562 RepID=A0ABN4ANA0_EMTOG|nr:peptidoglycan recognition family protein [Emticicia oligotrophica]AFK03613.1 N-acetylmuramyl-L-alanine amidase, negative regulator of AmpC, AmpD [Emticicia oligotrophica DSM 17448]